MNPTTKKFNDEFARIKIKILNRDNWKCLWGLEKHWGELDVHHIIARSLGGKNTKENLITVCRSCHDIIEVLPFEERVKKCQKILSDKYSYKYDV